MKYEKREPKKKPESTAPKGEQKNNPMHGIRVDKMVKDLVDYYGFKELGARIDIKCFTTNPNLNSSVKFLRTTDWAREKVERLYIKTFK